jgi:lipopolysaccharide/colanic/teichoic acid biosynthesis glycosyltransferase
MEGVVRSRVHHDPPLQEGQREKAAGIGNAKAPGVGSSLLREVEPPDVAMVTLAFLAAYVLRSAMGGFLTKPVFSLGNYSRFLLFGDLVALLGLAGFGLYRHRAWFDRFFCWWQLTRAMATVSVVMMASTFLMAARTYSRVMVLLYFPLALLFVGLGREALRRLVRRVKDQGLQLKRLLAVGSQEKLEELKTRVERYDLPGMEVVYLHTDSLRRHSSGQDLDPTQELVRWVQRERIREVLVFEDASTRPIAERALEKLLSLGVPMDLVPESQALLRPGSSVLGLWGFSMIPMGGSSRARVASPGKRAVDLVVSLPAILLGLPLHLLQLLLIKERPRLVSEERIGARGRPFSWTRYGGTTALNRALRWLEHYPRLRQVITGRASLVGIYPIPRQIWETLPDSVRVNAPDAPAGLVGPWTGPGSPGEVSELLTMNRNYVRRWSLEGDFRVLFQGSRRAPDSNNPGERG